ncbi:hypothetical protein [Streptomyces sp. NPDC006368]|uniref:hypothetical protein n=1 Tax=Streptomyces sp. NPDC006368 TaxID=3156760 RepID=UPI0033ACA609
MPEKDPCPEVVGPLKEYCIEDDGSGPPDGGGSPDVGGGGLTDGASDHVKDLAESLIKTIIDLLVPKKAWAPETSDHGLYAPFLWLGQHIAVAIFVCVVVVCALTAWQGAPRLRQMGASTGWTLVAVAGMASIPGAVMLLNRATSNAFRAAFNSSESTLFTTIRTDLKTGADSGNPVALLIIISALVVALAFAALVFMTRQPAILAFVCMAPLVLASLARGGDMTAVRRWAMRLLGLIFAPFALLLVSPFVTLAKGSLVMDAVLLVAADALMLRMIFHGVPYIGPRVAGAVRNMVERNIPHPAARAVVRAGAPAFYEQENTPRTPRTVDTPGRAVTRDRGVLLAAYGVKPPARPGRLTTASYVAKARREEGDRQARAAQVSAVRRQARAAAGNPSATRSAPPAPATPPTRPGPTQPRP